MATKQKTFEYHNSHSFVDNKGNRFSFASQLYKIGVYAIINNNPAMQGGFTPQQIVKIEKRLIKQNESGEITGLTFGRLLRVAEVDGFWQEVD